MCHQSIIIIIIISIFLNVIRVMLRLHNNLCFVLRNVYHGKDVG